LNAPANILTQPSAVNACIGANAVFTVVASNNAPNTYQWQVSTNGGTSFTDIAGATSASLTVNAVTLAMNNYQYRVIVDNGFGNATSTGAILSVLTTPAAQTVASASACEGSAASFSVPANAQLTYQWQVSTDGGTTYANIAGATSDTYAIANVVSANNNNRYRVIVTNSCGSSTSSAGALTVNALPTVSIGALPAKLCTSDNAIALTASMPGGTWSGTGVSGSHFNPAVTPGTHTISYTVSNSNGCSNTATANMLVEDCTFRNLALDNDGAIIIYPNPNGGVFNIRVNTAKYSSLTMRVYASDGKLVHVKVLSGLTYGTVRKIWLLNLANDVYHLQLRDETSGAQKTFPMILNR
jgi:hypothetical protein